MRLGPLVLAGSADYLLGVWDFKRLSVWERSRQLTIEIYGATSAFPATERFGLAAQMRRAANSIGANIAEGCGRAGGRDRARFFEIALGSVSELEHHLIVARDLSLLATDQATTLLAEIDEIQPMLKALRARSQGVRL